ncbi:AzlD domain-containing protein [Hydrogenophaga sp.]|uniref:AzlD domain-containing protein n=1 Tax=Hydrogenophaga sp. TaxID=1904254 RepID=UPI002725399B|nr:AzlD domain-containing protein [Hydrogenophaga sp.]MDO8276611.1 AzlD domain-containing protein [Burkholderiaceae bacterium]MDO9088922.1 AzlD domain-containing protein [Burkholderiaceae bacterium]MDP2018199.1 AzlD domain-containing protein [Hydrogenophaga sp.]
MSGETDLWTVGVILGLTLMTLVTRCFFLISSKPWTLPAWVLRGLQYAPIAALGAVVLPEIVMTQGQLINTLKDARIFGALTAIAVFYWRHSVLWTMLAGSAVYLPLHIFLKW